MTTNPYSAPTAVVSDPAGHRGSGIKAVSLGVLIDLGGTILISVIFIVVYGFYLAASGMRPEAVASAISSAGHDATIQGVLAIPGCLLSVLGGYVCARVARHSEYRLGLIVAVISMLFAVWMGQENYSLAMNAVLAIATLASVMLGVKLGVSKNLRKQ